MVRSAFSIVALVFFAVTSTAALSADSVTGVVVDQNGQPLPRAEVRALDQSGAETSHTFADEGGRFRLTASGGCRIAASLTGFQPASAPCTSVV